MKNHDRLLDVQIQIITPLGGSQLGNPTRSYGDGIREIVQVIATVIITPAGISIPPAGLLIRAGLLLAPTNSALGTEALSRPFFLSGFRVWLVASEGKSCCFFGS